MQKQKQKKQKKHVDQNCVMCKLYMYLISLFRSPVLCHLWIYYI